MTCKPKTQGERLAAAIRRKPMTYMEMALLCISTSPHKRILEWLKGRDDVKLVKKLNRQGLVTWSVRAAK